MEFTFVTTNDTKTLQYENPFSVKGYARTIVANNYQVGKIENPANDTLETEEEDAETKFQ